MGLLYTALTKEPQAFIMELRGPRKVDVSVCQTVCQAVEPMTPTDMSPTRASISQTLTPQRCEEGSIVGLEDCAILLESGGYMCIEPSTTSWGILWISNRARCRGKRRVHVDTRHHSIRFI